MSRMEARVFTTHFPTKADQPGGGVQACGRDRPCLIRTSQLEDRRKLIALACLPMPPDARNAQRAITLRR